MILATDFNSFEKGKSLPLNVCYCIVNTNGEGDLFRSHMTSLLGTGVFNSDGL